jgi:hypothetical protein
MRRPWGLMRIVLAGLVVAPFMSAAESAAKSPEVKAKGYLNLRYAYVGSASQHTIYQGLRLTGSFELSALSGKISLKYRSHHWVNFQKNKNAVLESPFENRNFFQSVYLEAKDLLAKGLKIRAGRMFPEMDYGSLMLIDGGWMSWDIGPFCLTASAGRTIDNWSGTPNDSKLQTAVGMRYQAEGVRACVGFNTGEYFGLKKTEIPAGLYLRIGQSLWLDAYGSYDLEAKDLARAGLSLSWRADGYSLSFMASQWRNPFDQLYLADKNRAAMYWADSANLPATYRDIRLSFSTNGKGFGFRGTAGWMGGVRSGWLGNAAVLFPALWGIRVSLGGQAMKTDFIEFYSVEAIASKPFGDILIQVQSQSRTYQWRPRPSGFHDFDNYTELSAEYPLQRHFYLSLAGGGYFRVLGNESFKPQVELRLIYRI